MVTMLGLSACRLGPEVTDKNEQEFIGILDNANIKEDEVSSARLKALCRPDLAKVQSWVGRVSAINTDGGQARLDVRIGGNYDLVDGSTGDGIKKEEAIYSALADLKEGDDVIFSGDFEVKDECIRPISRTQDGTTKTPDFTFNFTNLAPLPLPLS